MLQNQKSKQKSEQKETSFLALRNSLNFLQTLYSEPKIYIYKKLLMVKK